MPWYNYKGNKIGQGRENAKKYLEDHPEILSEIDRGVREYYNLDPDGAMVVPEKGSEEDMPIFNI